MCVLMYTVCHWNLDQQNKWRIHFPVVQSKAINYLHYCEPIHLIDIITHFILVACLRRLHSFLWKYLPAFCWQTYRGNETNCLCNMVIIVTFITITEIRYEMDVANIFFINIKSLVIFGQGHSKNVHWCMYMSASFVIFIRKTIFISLDYRTTRFLIISWIKNRKNLMVNCGSRWSVPGLSLSVPSCHSMIVCINCGMPQHLSKHAVN